MKDNNVVATGPNPGETPKPRFKNKAERNKGVVTTAMALFKDREMLLARPEGMSREEYRFLRKLESEAIKRIFHKNHSPNRKLQGVMGGKEPVARTKKGIARVAKRMITQRKTG